MDTPWFGEGSVKQIAKVTSSGRTNPHGGKWRLQWSYIEGGKKKTANKIFKSKADATTWRDNKKIELRTGVRRELAKAKTAPAALTLQAMFDELAGTRGEGFKDGLWVTNYGSTTQTVLTKYRRWTKWVKGSPIASRPIPALLRTDAYAHVKRMKDEGATIATMTDVIGILKHVVNLAILEKPECKDLLGNPFTQIVFQSHEEKAKAAVEKQIREASKPSKIVVGPKVAQDGLERIGSVQHLAILAVHFLGGLRLGEGMALSRSRIDFDLGIIVVDRAVHIDGNGQQYVGLPKKNKIRLVAMCPALAAILGEYVATLPEGRDYLFGQGRKDKPEMRWRYYDLWADALELTNLPKDMTTQDARVSHNNWIEKLMPNVSLSTRLEHMGHSLKRGDGQPVGVGVNITNYTAHIPDAYAILRRDIERTVFGPVLRVEQGGLAA